MKLHQKGFLLVELSKHKLIWDTLLINRAMQEYELSGRFWFNHFCISLDELAAAGLINRHDSDIDHAHFNSHRVMFQYALSEYGRERMIDTGLWPEEENK